MRLKPYLMSLVLLVCTLNAFAQIADPFAPPRYNQRLKGDILQFGNNILSAHPSNAYNTVGNPSTANDQTNMVYVDIDGDPTTFSSSSANLQVPNTSRDCYRISYAALYWSATYRTGDRSQLHQVKFKTPGSANYTDITGTLVYDEGVGNLLGNSCDPYAAYADVTSLITPTNAEGVYTVANVRASLGDNDADNDGNVDCPGGNAGGWILFIVYEDPRLPGKFITTFDGFAGINGTNSLTIPVNGFNTIPTGNVNAKLAFAALEGDNKITGDALDIRGLQGNPPFSTMGGGIRPTNNFFNSSFTDVSGNQSGRNPNSQNALGFDSGITDVANPANSVLGNNETNAEVRLRTSGDQYYLFFLGFSVEIIEPDILLTKEVENIAGQPIGNSNVTMCQELNYVIGFDNIGNDDAEGVDSQPAPYGNAYILIRDVLPINTTLVSVDVSNVPGTIVVPNPGNPRDLSIYVPRQYVTANESHHEIIIRVRVACTCEELTTACSNLILNQAFITYQGVVSNIVISNDPSSATFNLNCNSGSSDATNFLVGIDSCVYNTDVIICGTNATLTAGSGFDNYVWTGPAGATFVPNNTSQTVTVNMLGTYTVNGTDAVCRPIVQTFNVIQFGAGLTNPIIPYDENPTPVICTDNGERLPYIFLCGSGDSQLLQTNITNATNVQWFLYNPALAGCGPYPATNCPVTNAACWTNQVGTGSNYTVTAAGMYSVVFTFPGGCTRTFYFNVYQNLLDPQIVKEDIICGSPGSITVTNVSGSGYEYQLLNGAVVVFPWQPSNIFTPINTAGTYTVQVRPTTFSGGCVFTVPNIGIQVLDVTVTTIVTQPLCFGEQGAINIQITGVPGQYYYTLHQGTIAGPVVGSVGPTNATFNVFSNLTPGQTYTWETHTDDGCSRTGTFTINNPPQLVVNSAITVPLTSCTDGEITVNVSGGTPPYFYYVNSLPPAPFTTSNVIPVTTPGTYTITVYDSNNCFASTQQIITLTPPPTFTVSSTNILCYGTNSGTITFNVTNANGNALMYSIDGGVTWQSNPVFTNVPPGAYSAVVQYTFGTAVCTSVPQNITITEPAQALTASGGVAAVACDSNGGNGIVRITNVQGGTPYPAPNPYQYNFGSGYQNSNQANLPPGTYTISVRDANLCEFFMTVTLDPIPAPPTINVGAPTFNCNGSATSTVTVNNGASSYTYTYSINPPLVPPHDPNSNVFQNVQCGNSVVTVNYTLVSPPTFSNLLNEDFGIGNDTTSPGINPAYCFERQINNPAIYCKTGPQINDGDYSVTKRILFPFGAWYPFLDHTTNGTNPNARFLAINIGGVAGVGGILYSKPITDIIPNQDIRVSLWAANLLRIDPSNTQSPPDLTIQLVRDLGLPTETIIAASNTGNIPKSNAWINYQLTLNPGPNTSLSFVIRSNIAVTSGNDVVIDDINVFQLPVACLTTRNFPINIPCNQAFTAQVTGHRDVSCAGANDATITVAAQNFNTTNGFQVSMDNGATWVTYFTSPQTIPVPAAYPGFVLIRYDAAPGNAACSFNLPQTIITPTPLTLSAVNTAVTCLAGATITATAGGGTPAYQYQLTTSLGAVVVAYQSSNVFTNIPAGSYIVTVRDFNLCTRTFPISFVGPTTPILTLSPTSDFCFDSGNQATLVVTASNGVAPYSFSINGSAYVPSNTPVNSHTFSNLVPGTYTISVTDSFGCTNTAVFTQTINPQLTVNTVLTKDFDCTASPNAVITGTIAGGYPGYTYAVSYNSGAFVNLGAVAGSSFTYSIPTANPGTYQFQITDTRGCTVLSTITTINALSIPVLTINPLAQNLACFGDSTGSVTWSVAGGTPVFTINILNNTTGINYGTQTSGLPAGNYTATVTDSKSCTDTENFVITQPAQLTFTPAITPITCNPVGGYTLGQICANAVTGGTAPFTYTLVDLTGGTANQVFGPTAATTHCFTGVDFGIYDIFVTDANGCTFVRPNQVMSNPPSDLTFVVSPTIPSCAAGATIDVTLVGAIGAGPFQFGIVNLTAFPWSSSFANASNPPFQHQFTGLAPGTFYTIVVRDLTTGCYYFEAVNTATPTNSTLNPTYTPNNVTCRGANDGSITITGISGIHPSTTSIQYTINYSPSNVPIGPAPTGTIVLPAVFPITIGGALTPGTYNIHFTEIGGPAISGCGITTAPFVISQSATVLALTATTTPDNCNVNAGVITAVASGGTAPYTYQYLVCGTPAPTASSLGWLPSNTFNAESGCYDVYVKDAFGCIRTVTVNIALDPTPVVAASVVNACATQNNFAINVTLPTAGIAPYSFSIDGGAYQVRIPPFTISGLSSGTHTVQVRDNNGCGNLVSVTILAPLSASGTFTTQPTCRNADGTITVVATGGSGNYTYTLAPTTNATGVFTGIAPGTYTVTITDTTTTCTTTATVTLVAPIDPTFTATSTPPSCNGGSNGSLVVNLTGANVDPVYTYQIIAPIGFATGPQTSNVFNGLPAGPYTIQVNSGRGCFATQIFNIGQPPVVNVPAPAVTQFACNAGTNSFNLATITVNGVTGGTGTYTIYEFVLGGTVVQSGSSNVYSTANTAGGTYTVNVYDTNGCLGSTTAVINPFISISNPVVTVVNPITCTTLENITVSVTTTGGPAPVYNYTINSIPPGFTQSNTTGIFNGLPIGDYLITITNPVTNCSVEIIHYVFDPNTFDINTSLITNVSCVGGNNGSVNLTFVDNQLSPTNDAGPFNYVVTNTTTPLVIAGSSATAGPTLISGLTAGLYTVTATLVNSPRCTVTTNFIILEPSQVLDITATQTPLTCAPGNDASITVVATGGWGSYSYTLNPGAVTNTTGVFTGLTGTINYTITVTDALGCQDFVNVTITRPAQITANPIANVQLTCFGVNNGSVTVTGVTGGQNSPTDYVYTLTYPDGSVSGPQASPTFNNLSPGNYSVVINDPFNCLSAPIPFTVLPATQIIATLTKVPNSQVCDTSQEQLLLTASGGTGVFFYSLSQAGPWLPLLPNPLNLGLLPAGPHTYYVRDSNNCTAVVSNTVVIDTLDPLTLAILPITDFVLDCSYDVGTIYAQATGGEGAYTYTLLPGGATNTTGIFNGIGQGVYTVQVTSGDCTMVQTPVQIDAPEELRVTAVAHNTKCSYTNDGDIVITLTGVDGRPIQYELISSDGVYTGSQSFDIPDPSQPFTIPNLGPGTYTLNVHTVPSNCGPLPISLVINRPNPIAFDATVMQNETCFNAADGEIIVDNITGGTTLDALGNPIPNPYQITLNYVIDNTTNPPTDNSVYVPLNNLAGAGTHVFPSLAAGTYLINVTDGNGCDFPQSVTIIPGDNYEPIVQVTYPCNPLTNEPMVRIEVLNTVAPNAFGPGYTFQLDGFPAQSSPIFESTNPVYTAALSIPTNHSIMVFSPTGCNKPALDPADGDAVFDVTPLTALDVVLSQGGLNTALATASGGSGNYSYTFYANGQEVQSGSSNTYVYFQQYNSIGVVVTDNISGCNIEKSRPLPYYPIFIPNVFTPGDGGGWAPDNTSNYPNLVTKIYDRYGRLVKTLPEGDRWDGKYEGKDLPSGDYWYVVKVDGKDADEYVGHFTLYR
ncbi:T9SS type B sorting domain-containing protein [Flavobacterium amnicola]|uniref:T9SS type B sorting domain-containing protein n=1 Tax=Flavobacterium amnicola TaxID=2506422 RepID=A0A4Q1K6W2_9FLAO|nr:T9SS type B sorting domain-containing protein [Flavobacterium amnicola]RXR20984.1 T9SS type B sorting domain-containing protein [Flavobacterium amnicola]